MSIYCVKPILDVYYITRKSVLRYPVVFVLLHYPATVLTLPGTLIYYVTRKSYYVTRQLLRYP